MSPNKKKPFWDIEIIFLQALDYPEFARPEYFIKQQKKSGWSKGVFLRALMDSYYRFKERIEIYGNIERSRLEKVNQKLPIDFGIDVSEIIKDSDVKKLTSKMLEELQYALEYAYKYGEAKPVFNSFQIISFSEKFLLQIKREFQEQVKKDSSATYYANKQRAAGRVVDGKPEYVLYHYNIISDAPVFDFFRFRDEVRKLLLNSKNPENLVTMLKPFYDLGVEIVEIWNNQLQPLEEPVDENEQKKGLAIFERKLLSFDPENRKIWNVNTNSDEDFYRRPSSHFMNRDFAVFALQIANFVNGEILKGKKQYKVKGKKYSDFDELFINPSALEYSYYILKDKGLIDELLNFRGKLKSIIVVWIRELHRAGLIHHESNGIYCLLINKKIKGLGLSQSNFSIDHKRAKEQLEGEFRVYFKNFNKSN